MLNNMAIGPSSAPSGYSKMELEVMARENGWQKPQTLDAYYRLSPAAASWFERCFPKEFEKLCEKPERPRHYERKENQSDSEAAAEALHEVVAKFKKLHPQYVQNRANLNEVSRRRQELGIAIENYSYEVLCDLYQALLLEGRIEVRPSVIGLDFPEDDTISGALLKRYIRERPNWERLLDEFIPEPTEALDPIASMSAAEYDNYDVDRRNAEREEQLAFRDRRQNDELDMMFLKRPDAVNDAENREKILTELDRRFGVEHEVINADALCDIFDSLWSHGKIGKATSRLVRTGRTEFQDHGTQHIGQTIPVSSVESMTDRKWIATHDSEALAYRLTTDKEFRDRLDAAGE